VRQSGIVAAMALYALEHHVERLADDHVRARYIATALVDMAMVANVEPVDTNIIVFDLAEGSLTGPQLVASADTAGVQIGSFTDRRCRIVTHLDVDDGDVERLIEVLKPILG